MNWLMVIAIATWVISFLIIVRFSRMKYKYNNGDAVANKVAVKAWTTQGGRTAYYRLAIGLSGLITVGVIAIVKVCFH